MRRFGSELLGTLLAAAYWTSLVVFLYKSLDSALYVSCGLAVALAASAKGTRLDGTRFGIGLLLGVIGAVVVVGVAAGAERLAGGVGAMCGGAAGYVAWRVLVSALRKGPTWGVPEEKRMRWGTRLAEWGGLLGASSGLCLAVLHGTAGFAGDVKLQGYDTIASPDEVIKLSAKLEKQGILGLNPDLHGVQLEFEVDGKSYGLARTETEGVAFVEVSPRQIRVGVHSVKVTVSDKEKGREGSDTFVLVVMDKDAEWAPCDLDHTVCATEDWKFSFQENDVIKTLPGAPAAVTAVSKKIQLVYITGRDDVFMSKTRAWLDANGFPKGPTFFMDWNLWGLDVEKFKGDTIEALAKRLPNVKVGFGDLPTDARAYLRNKLTPYILRSKPPEEYPEGITPVKSWEEILDLLRKAGRL